MMAHTRSRIVVSEVTDRLLSTSGYFFRLMPVEKYNFVNKRKFIKDFHIFLIYITTIYFLSSILCLMARADISDIYITTMCDPVGGMIQISIDRVGQWDALPENSGLLSAIHDHKKIATPVQICSLGKKREIALFGSVDGDHPRNDELVIYIGTSEFPYRINVSKVLDTHSVIIRRMPDDYYVSIEECDPNEACHSEVHTDPSFDCHEAFLGAERIICGTESLAELDVKLNKIYISLLDVYENKRLLIQGQIKWIHMRDIVCDIPKAQSDWRASRSNPLAAADCLKTYYADRINYLERLIAPK